MSEFMPDCEYHIKHYFPFYTNPRGALIQNAGCSLAHIIKKTQNIETFERTQRRI